MGKFLFGAFVIIVGGAGLYYYQDELGIRPPASAAAVSISFACTDNTHFIAEFPETMETAKIVVDGTVVRTLPHVEGAGQRYEDATYAYVFAGEEATVTNKANNTSATCSQPFDPNLAPFNFGDAGEGAGSAQPDVALVVTESIQGKWKSVDDEKFVREFKDGDVVVDWYDGETTSTGMWAAFTKATAPEVPYPLEDDAVYLQLTLTGSQADTLYFRLAKLTPEELEMVYLDRGNVLRFTLMQ